MKVKLASFALSPSTVYYVKQMIMNLNINLSIYTASQFKDRMEQRTELKLTYDTVESLVVVVVYPLSIITLLMKACR